MPIKVLFVDDEPDLCEIFTDEFSSATVRVSTFTNPLLAIDAAKSNPPDIIFLDYRMPQMTGDKVALKMPQNIPIYLLTGDHSISTTFSFKGILTKPVPPKVIHELIKSLYS